MKTSLLYHFDQQNGRFFTFQRLKPPEPLTDGEHRPRNRPRGLSPRSYQARVDLCRVWELMLQGRSQAEIVRLMS